MGTSPRARARGYFLAPSSRAGAYVNGRKVAKSTPRAKELHGRGVEGAENG